ncbi:MAG: DsbC family protein [Gammaproteobacteria bacterium]|nr:DsbC family protein [Gammaproteobacteria bacterium]
MKIVSTICVLIGLSLGFSGSAFSYEESQEQSQEKYQEMLSAEQVKEKLKRARPDLPVTGVTTSILPGFFEVTLLEGSVLFVNEDATYFITGDLYRIEENRFVNVSEEQRNVNRRELLAAVDESEMVVFSPPMGMKKTSVTVFTDIDCGFCRKLHKEVPELNRLGIEVRYLAYPRAGLKSKSYDKYVSAWCSDNQQLALTQAKLGQELEEKTCENPVAAQYALGNLMGVSGTPAIVFDDGTMLPGYLPAVKLASRLGIY